LLKIATKRVPAGTLRFPHKAAPLSYYTISRAFATRNDGGFGCNKKMPCTNAGRREASVIEEIANLPAGSDTGDKGLNKGRNGEHTNHLLYESTAHIRNEEANQEAWGFPAKVDQT